MTADRRSFLKAAGFSVTGLLAGCARAPVEKAIPYLVKPEEITPGKAYYYASTCGACPARCGVLVKNRDGRPIKLEGNPDHPLSRGGLCAVGQASILGLYDSHRLKHPLIRGRKAEWREVDAQIGARLAEIRGRGGRVAFLSGTVNSPTLRAAIEAFGAEHIVFEALSSSAIPEAHERTHGARVLPHYRFDRADVIVSFDADFLGTWISPVEFTAAWRTRRNPPEMSYHVQYESRLSLTGTKADRRVCIDPDESRALLSRLLEIPELGERLRAARGRSLVVSGSESADEQVLVNRINQELGNYGATVDIEKPSYQREGSGVVELAGVDALFIYDSNPVYHRPELKAAMERIPLVVSFAPRLDETAALAHYVCPDHHWLESWGDAEPVSGTASLFQPAIEPLGNTRPVIESLAAFNGRQQKAYDAVREHWRFPEDEWRKALEIGAFECAGRQPKAPLPNGRGPEERRRPEGAFSLILYPKVGMLDGAHSYNPWLHELPDPVTKITWDNYACLAPPDAAKLGVENGDVVRVEANGKSIELPALVQPGQHRNTVAIAIGYGSKGTERFAKAGPQWLYAKSTVGPNGLVGVNAAVLRGERYVRIARTGRKHLLACAQTQATMVVQPPAHEQPRANLWPDDHRYTGRRWAMAIDLTACTGCSACVIACQVENNVPVAGKDEVARKRGMHWLRIDRYYSGGGENVDVTHQPMMCQQCGNAPCETVCPVVATVHSAEGLNQQVYNRCVGTRYCENNCPYKARRFNWFEYAREDRLANLVLNPDVTVRGRGVMEKCSFCVQRIQERKIDARADKRALADGEIQTACQQSCPAQAIVFGDINDPKSRVAQLAKSNRGYRVLEETNVEPAVTYLAPVRHRPEKKNG